jgi:hypothetical protein
VPGDLEEAHRAARPWRFESLALRHSILRAPPDIFFGRIVRADFQKMIS